jgi:hypothetical protein
MKIVGIKTITGPNVFSHKPVLVMTLDLEELAGKESCDIPGFVDRLLAFLPGLQEHHCSLGRRGGFVERLRAGTYFGHVVEHVALELTDSAGISVNRRQERSNPAVPEFTLSRWSIGRNGQCAGIHPRSVLRTAALGPVLSAASQRLSTHVFSRWC